MRFSRKQILRNFNSNEIRFKKMRRQREVYTKVCILQEVIRETCTIKLVQVTLRKNLLIDRLRQSL
jgi:hypothetical protein